MPGIPQPTGDQIIVSFIQLQLAVNSFYKGHLFTNLLQFNFHLNYKTSRFLCASVDSQLHFYLYLSHFYFHSGFFFIFAMLLLLPITLKSTNPMPNISLSFTGLCFSHVLSVLFPLLQQEFQSPTS